LYQGKLGLEVAEAQHLLEGLDWPAAVADIAASAKWLKDEGSSKVIRHAEIQDRLRTYVTGPSSKFAKGPS
jgi:hypothetical protein